METSPSGFQLRVIGIREADLVPFEDFRVRRSGWAILAIPNLKYNSKTPFKKKWFYPVSLVKPLTFSRFLYCIGAILVFVLGDDFFELLYRHRLLFDGDVFTDMVHDFLTAQLIVQTHEVLPILI